jgi:hypothetical protein
MLHSIVATQKLLVSSKKEKHPATVPPPDEATLLHLNKIAKESPFCYYYKGRTNDLL